MAKKTSKTQIAERPTCAPGPDAPNPKEPPAGNPPDLTAKATLPGPGTQWDKPLPQKIAGPENEIELRGKIGAFLDARIPRVAEVIINLSSRIVLGARLILRNPDAFSDRPDQYEPFDMVLVDSQSRNADRIAAVYEGQNIPVLEV